MEWEGTQSYKPTQHHFFDITRKIEYTHGHVGTSVEHSCQVFEAEGKLPKEKLNEWKAYAEQKIKEGNTTK